MHKRYIRFSQSVDAHLLIACPRAIPSRRNCVGLLGIRDGFSCRWGIGDYCRKKSLALLVCCYKHLAVPIHQLRKNQTIRYQSIWIRVTPRPVWLLYNQTITQYHCPRLAHWKTVTGCLTPKASIVRISDNRSHTHCATKPPIPVILHTHQSGLLRSKRHRLTHSCPRILRAWPCL